jgi:hypothetical protein
MISADKLIRSELAEQGRTDLNCDDVQCVTIFVAHGKLLSISHVTPNPMGAEGAKRVAADLRVALNGLQDILCDAHEYAGYHQGIEKKP